MEITKKIFALLFGFLVNCSNIFAKPAAPAAPALDDLNELNKSILELEQQSSYAWKAMNWIRTEKGYPDRSYVKCNLPIYLLYKRSVYNFHNVNKMQQHLKKFKNTLRPLFDATIPQSSFTKGATNATLRTALDNLAKMYIVSPLWALARMGYTGSGNIAAYNTTKLTERVQIYMTCANIPITSNATQFLRYVIFIEALNSAVNSLAGDLSFIQAHLSKTN